MEEQVSWMDIFHRKAAKIAKFLSFLCALCAFAVNFSPPRREERKAFFKILCALSVFARDKNYIFA